MPKTTIQYIKPSMSPVQLCASYANQIDNGFSGWNSKEAASVWTLFL